MKLLFINAINQFSESETRYPNLGIGYLASSLRDALGDDAIKFRVVCDNIIHELSEFEPDIVGISAVSQNYGIASKYAAEAKRRGIPVIVGGVHISFLPNALTSDMTVGCIGEGEDTIIDIIKIYRDKGVLNSDDLALVKGIVYWEREGSLAITSNRLTRQNLDSISFPARDLLSIGKHTYLFTSRGCPYRCVFCSSSRFWDEVRFFSAKKVVDEIEFLINNYGTTFISFFDDLFVADKKRFFSIIDLLEGRGIVGRVKFSCSLRANTVSEEVVKGLKRMGVVSVGMGLESGNQRVLSWLKGAGITVEQNREAVGLLRKYGITPNASFVIGSPDETEEEILDTLRFIKTVDLGLFDVYTLTPYPGTPVWEIAKEHGVVSEGDDMDWSRLNVNFEVNQNKAIILSKTLSRDDIIRLYRIFRRYRFLHNIRNVWSHPMLSDLPRYAVKLARERFMRLFLQ